MGHETLPRAILASSVTGMVLILLFVFPIYNKEKGRDDVAFNWEGHDPRTSLLVCWLVLFGMCASIAIFSTLIMKGKMPHRRDGLEFSSVFLCWTSILCMIFYNPWSIAGAYGKEPGTVWASEMRGVEGSNLLAIDFVVTAVSLFIPIRVSMVWIIHLSVVLLLPARTVAFGSPFPDDSANRISIMIALTSFAYCGVWRNERSARIQWLSIQTQQGIVQEREIELSQQQIELEESSALARGMQSVLGGLCDVIFKLDSSSKVVGTNTACDYVFGCAMEGQVLTNAFVDDGCVLRFTSLLERASSSGLLQTMNATMCQQHTMQKTCFDVQLFAVDLQIGRQVKQLGEHYLIGMRMIQGEGSLPERNVAPSDLIPNVALENLSIQGSAVQSRTPNKTSEIVTSMSTSEISLSVSSGAKTMQTL